MKIAFPQFRDKSLITPWIAAIGALIVFGLGAYAYFSLSTDFKIAKSKFASETTEFETRISELEQNLTKAQTENTSLTEALKTEQGKNDYFDFQLKSISGTVGTLHKLSLTDPELLKKYSKVYFLNENYIPATLIDITSSEYVHKNGKSVSIHTNAWLYLIKLLSDVKENSIPLQVVSAYRSFGEQSSLKANYKMTYGAGTANQFSADQGYSEHQLGTAVDFTTPDSGADFNGFKNSSAYTWLTQNAHKYGFTLSYPENNSYYQFEPWHWRFVGVALATKLYNESKHFYDLDQREINQYLVNLFD